MKFSVFQLSRKGGREKNEDRMGYTYTRDAGLFVLADGMGGHPEGEVAAQIALQTVSAVFQREALPRLANPTLFLSEAVMAAHHQIIRYASGRGMLDTPRTTLVAGLIQSGELYWVHCGDSRLYVVRDGALVLRTRDHSYCDLPAPAAPPLEAMSRNVLFTCLGSTVRPLFEVAGSLRLQEGDKVLLCSDGLWGAVDEDEIVRTLHALPVAEAVPTLIEQALRIGGARADNVTLLALEWETPAIEREASGFTQTETMDDGVFASTILTQEWPDTLVEALDEAEIERSIAEINAAIQRTARGR